MSSVAVVAAAAARSPVALAHHPQTLPTRSSPLDKLLTVLLQLVSVALLEPVSRFPFFRDTCGDFLQTPVNTVCADASDERLTHSEKSDPPLPLLLLLPYPTFPSSPLSPSPLIFPFLQSCPSYKTIPSSGFCVNLLSTRSIFALTNKKKIRDEG